MHRSPCEECRHVPSLAPSFRYPTIKTSNIQPSIPMVSPSSHQPHRPYTTSFPASPKRNHVKSKQPAPQSPIHPSVPTSLPSALPSSPHPPLPPPSRPNTLKLPIPPSPPRRPRHLHGHLHLIPQPRRHPRHPPRPHRRLTPHLLHLPPGGPAKNLGAIKRRRKHARARDDEDRFLGYASEQTVRRSRQRPPDGTRRRGAPAGAVAHVDGRKGFLSGVTGPAGGAGWVAAAGSAGGAAGLGRGGYGLAQVLGGGDARGEKGGLLQELLFGLL